MNGIISGLAAQYGRHLVCYDENGKVIGEGEAFFQPLTERQWQRSAGRWGLTAQTSSCAWPQPDCPRRAGGRRLGGV